MGRPPIGKRAMTAPERQQRYRKRLAQEKARQDREAKQAGRRVKNEAPFSAGQPVPLHTLTGPRYGTVYADPPWLYDNQATRAATGNHYDGLTVEALMALPVRELAAADAHCHLWTTSGFLHDALHILDAWGFVYKANLVWIKPNIGLGNYWRNAHEILLTGVRGNATRFAENDWKSWHKQPRGSHSEKPEFVRDIIKRVSPGPWLELFARGDVDPDWTAWGNQASGQAA